MSATLCLFRADGFVASAAALVTRDVFRMDCRLWPLCPVLGSWQTLISLSTGDVINADFRPMMSSNKGLLQNPDNVPFRLTRNFQVRQQISGFLRGRRIRPCCCSSSSVVRLHCCRMKPLSRLVVPR